MLHAEISRTLHFVRTTQNVKVRVLVERINELINANVNAGSQRAIRAVYDNRMIVAS